MKLALPTGGSIDLDRPHEHTFTLQEISELLSNINRFSGTGISVVQHSVEVAESVWRYTGCPDMALLHDAHEAFLGDIPEPVKVYLGMNYDEMERNLQSAIMERFTPPNTHKLHKHPIIYYFDKAHLKVELMDLIRKGKFNDCHREWENVMQLFVPNDLGRIDSFHKHMFKTAYDKYYNAIQRVDCKVITVFIYDHCYCKVDPVYEDKLKDLLVKITGVNIYNESI